MSDHAESSTAATAATSTMLSRNDDHMTVALRSDRSISLDDLVYLNQTAPRTHDIPSSLGTLTTTVFSSQKESSVTKPTSAGTSYVIDGYNGKGKGKAVVTYASSLSATHGSGSEAEAEQDNALFGVGDQFEINPLKGAAKARKRPRVNRKPKSKKPVLVIHQQQPVPMSSDMDVEAVIEQSSRRSSKETKYLRHRQLKKSDNRLSLTDEERVVHANEANPARRFSRARLNVIIVLCAFIALTFAFSVFAAHHTGKGRLACTKGIIFSATVLISVSTVLAMTLARLALQEALLAGLLEFLIGFALVIEIHDFMGHSP
ncbi:hypothetical protein N0V90_007184 [Kalmusia sp. IMI 367209]|nr:hypothetical protein N0V90_007184 [Kalmusia sp. IMI 367209]